MQDNRPNKALAAKALETTAKIIDDLGPRLTGTDPCLKSAGVLKEGLAKHCDEVFQEEFQTHPASFLSFMKYYAASYVAAIFFLLMGGWLLWPAILLLLFGTLMSLSQFVFYREYFDSLHAKKTGVNVYGIIEPREDVRQQIIVSGHHDSPWEFNYLASRWQKYYAIRIILGVFWYVSLCALCLLAALWKWNTGAEPGFLPWIVCFALPGLVFVVPFYWFVGKKASPGAGDNLIASVMTVEVAGLFSRKNGEPPLRHTRLIAASFDAEEAGLRGSRAFARKHEAELKDIPTFVFNMDSIYEAKELKFLRSDLNGYVRLSSRMAGQCRDAARALGYNPTLNPMVFGGGGTDAAEFAKIGVPATTLLAMSTKHVREGLTYHTCKDTVDCVEPEAVQACLDIAYHYILLKDRAAANR